MVFHRIPWQILLMLLLATSVSRAAVNESPLADDLMNWPAEGKIQDPKILFALKTSPLVDLSYCPQLLDASHDEQQLRNPVLPRPVIVLFCIPNGSRGRPWNQIEPSEGEIGVVELSPGQTLRLLNFDEDTPETSGKHRLHTNGGVPCQHQPGQLNALVRDTEGAIAEISYYDCPVSEVLMDPLDAQGYARLYDHFDGRSLAPFYVRVSDELGPVLIEP